MIKGYNELLTNPSINDEQRARAVERVRREIDRMDLLVADLLLSAEVREAPQHLNTRVELSALVESRVDEFRNDHPERDVSSELASGLAVRGREDLLERLLVNSFSNIVRHTQSDAAVRVTLRRDGSRAVLVVEDAGGGLPEYGVRPQRFRRFDQSRSRETGGTIVSSALKEMLRGTEPFLASTLAALAARWRLLRVRSAASP